jgi:hypothetical protein
VPVSFEVDVFDSLDPPPEVGEDADESEDDGVELVEVFGFERLSVA